MLTKTENYPFLVIEYSSDSLVREDTGAEITNLAKTTYSKIVKDLGQNLYSTSKYERQQAMKALTVGMMQNLIDSVDGVSSNMPGDIGRKLSGIYLKETVKGASTLELTFSKLTVEEADSVCFNKGATYRLFGGYNYPAGVKIVDCMFEGCVQNPTFSYDSVGVTVVLLLASHKYTKLAYLKTPFNIFNSFEGAYANDPSSSVSFPIRTVKEFLMAVKMYLGCNILYNFETESDFGSNLKKVFGFSEEELAADKSNSASFEEAINFWDMIKNQMDTQRWEDSITKSLYYVPVKDILDMIVSVFKINWFMTSFGELFFGIVEKPYDTYNKLIAAGKKVKKLFSFRPFGTELLSGFVDKMIYDPFESFDIVDIRNESPVEEVSTGTIDIKTPVDQNATEGDESKKDLTSGVTSDNIVDQTINSGNVELNIYSAIYEQQKKALIKTPLQTYLDTNKEFVAKLIKSGDDEFFARSNLVGKINKALGDPKFSITDIFYFEGITKHTGQYVVVEVEHIWNFGGVYTMNITGVKPYPGEKIPKNAVLQDTLKIVAAKEVESKSNVGGGAVILQSGTNFGTILDPTPGSVELTGTFEATGEDKE